MFSLQFNIILTLTTLVVNRLRSFDYAVGVRLKLCWINVFLVKKYKVLSFDMATRICKTVTARKKLKASRLYTQILVQRFLCKDCLKQIKSEPRYENFDLLLIGSLGSL